MDIKQAKQLSYTVTFAPQPNGSYEVSVPAMPECLIDGRTLEEARLLTKKAIEGYIEECLQEGEAIPEDLRIKPVFEKVAVTVQSKQLSYTVIFEPTEEGGYVVRVPAIQGCVTQGETLQEAREMAQDAAAGLLEVLVEEGKPFPPDIKEQPFYEKLMVKLHATTT